MSKRILEYSPDFIITCDCGCKYTFDKIDIKDGKVGCPLCGKENTVNSNKESK